MYLSRAFIKARVLCISKHQRTQRFEYKRNASASFLQHALDVHEAAVMSDNAPINEVKKRSVGQKNLHESVEQLVGALGVARSGSARARVASVGDYMLEKEVATLVGADPFKWIQEDASWIVETPLTPAASDLAAENQVYLPDNFEKIISMLQSGSFDAALHLALTLAFPGNSLSLLLLHITNRTEAKLAMQVCIRLIQEMRPRCTLRTLVRWLRHLKLSEHDIEDFDKLMNIIEENGLFERGVAKFNASFRSELWSRLMGWYSKLDNLEQANRVLNFMDSNGIELSNRGAQMACVLYAKRDELEHAERLFTRLERENDITPLIVDKLLEMYSRLQRPRQAELLVERMKKMSADLGIGPYNRLLLAYGRVGRLQDAQELFRSLESQLGFKPTKDSYAALSYAHGQAGDYHGALTVLENMYVTLNAIPTRPYFSSVMNAAAEAGDGPFVEIMLGRMQQFGIKVDIVILHIQIKAYLKSKNTQAAINTLRAMRESPEEYLWPTAWSYYTIIDYFRCHNIPTTEIENWMKEDQVELEPTNHASNIVHLLRQKDTEKAMDQFQQVRAARPDWGPHAYLAALQHYARRRNWKKGDQILEQLAADAIRLTPGAYSVMIEYYCLKGAIADVERTLTALIKEMDSSGAAPNTSSILTVLKAFTKAKSGDSLRRFWAALNSLPHYRPSLAEYSAMFHGLCFTKLFIGATNLAKQVVSGGQSVSEALAGNLVLDYQFCSAVAAELMCPAVAQQRKNLLWRAQKEKAFHMERFNAQLFLNKEMQRVLKQHKGNAALEWIVFDPVQSKQQMSQDQTAKFAEAFENWRAKIDFSQLRTRSAAPRITQSGRTLQCPPSSSVADPPPSARFHK